MNSKQLLVLIFVLSVLTLLYVRSRFLAVELHYKLSQRVQEKRMLEKQKRELHLELSILQSPRVIEEKAKEKFDLRYSPQGISRKIYIDRDEKGTRP